MWEKGPHHDIWSERLVKGDRVGWSSSKPAVRGARVHRLMYKWRFEGGPKVDPPWEIRENGKYAGKDHWEASGVVHRAMRLTDEEGREFRFEEIRGPRTKSIRIDGPALRLSNDHDIRRSKELNLQMVHEQALKWGKKYGYDFCGRLEPMTDPEYALFYDGGHHDEPFWIDRSEGYHELEFSDPELVIAIKNLPDFMKKTRERVDRLEEELL